MPLDGTHFYKVVEKPLKPDTPVTGLLVAGLSGPGAAAILAYMLPRR
jgi:hypothetical protein